MAKETEACGRCSMTVVVDAVDDEGKQQEDPFGDDRIEVEENQLERVSPEAWFGRVSSRVDSVVSRLAWGR